MNCQKYNICYIAEPDKNKGDSSLNQVMISLFHCEIIYDIQNIAWIRADTLQLQDEHNRHLLKDIAQDGNIDRTNRLIRLHAQELYDILYSLTNQPLPTDANPHLTNQEPNETQYDYLLQLPQNFSNHNLQYLADLMHEYICISTLLDWCHIIAHKNTEYFIYLKQETANKIKAQLARRTQPTRKPMRPF